MKRFLTAVAVALFLMSAAAPAGAFDSPIKEEKGRAILGKMGGDLKPLGVRLGCPDFAWASFVDEGRVAALVYVPAGAKYKETPRKVSITIHALPGKPAEDKELMTKLAQSLVAGYQKNGKIIKQDVFQNAKGEPGMYLEYTLGDGDKKEYNAGVFMRLTSYTAAFVQLQSRGKALSADDLAKVKAMIGGGSSAKAPAAPAGKKG